MNLPAHQLRSPLHLEADVYHGGTMVVQFLLGASAQMSRQPGTCGVDMTDLRAAPVQ